MKYIRWDEYYAVAEDLHKKIGTINVPANYIYKGYPIGEWISRQRGIERKNGLKSVRKKKRIEVCTKEKTREAKHCLGWTQG